MIARAFYIPKDGKDGEDANFVANGWGVIGGIDAGIFARQLMKHSAALVKRWPCGLSNPVEILEEALSKTTAKGTSTACVLSLKGKWLHAAVLGDSGFAVVRNKVIYRSPDQQSEFNAPYQLGKASPTSCSTLDALRITVAVKTGDLVVLGTDGLFDNMYNKELEGVIASSLRDGQDSPEGLARNIAEEAHKLSLEAGRESPFYLKCVEEHGKEKCPPGGKRDDITVIVARVTCTCG
ncbi:unnamed protein product [Spirodela intermedia]|uniref:Protein phosphatase n=2 Tax=Spirodela intermedia TaxID=51605 RepID=A0A7I8KTZ1_SPIIN|nr:unnamed protein product [Spirodela intermedia]CAA6664529.1 unnamed protein product [Spirodela intermedia]CAA7401111.1 unnamed protein product [Spirodela intermedia]